MFEIFCQNDLNRFKSNGQYPAVFGDYLQARFQELKDCLEEFFEDEGEFNLKEFGHLVVLSPSTDNLNDLHEVGLNPEDNGLFGSIPEVVEEVVMPEWSVYQISVVYNNSFMMIFYLPKNDVEDNAQFQAFLKKHPPSTIYFEPKGSRKIERPKAKYLFNGTKYITQGVDIHIPLPVQLAIWQFIAKRAEEQKPLMDYLQIFNLTPGTLNGKSVQKIECVQEQPQHKVILKVESGFTVNEKIYVIDDVKHMTMLLANEY